MRTRLFARMSQHPWLVGVVAIVLTALLAVPFLTMAPDGTASQEPAGEIFDARDLVAERRRDAAGHPAAAVGDHRAPGTRDPRCE